MERRLSKVLIGSNIVPNFPQCLLDLVAKAGVCRDEDAHPGCTHVAVVAE